MQLIAYLLFLLLVFPLSWLPFSILYVLSDGIAFLLYRVIGYRRRVVRQNLQRAFPDKTQIEIRRIEQRFYRHLADLTVESIKGFSISRKELQRRMVIVNPDLMERLYREGRSITMVTGHYGNWEYLPRALSWGIPHLILGIYKPLKNRYFDRLIQSTRAKDDLVLVPVKQVKEVFLQYKEKLVALGFVADQSPSRKGSGLVVDFMGIPTPVLYGPEKYARAFNTAVVYGKVSQIKRGYYQIEGVLLTEEPQEQPEGAITKAHTHLLEAQIREQPALWLWSHKRWKHVPQ